MSPELCNDRSYALALAKRYFYERNVTLDTFVGTFGETSDPLIARLVDIVIHEPARSGKFITVSQRDYANNYWPHVVDVLQQLERGEHGTLPALRPWSKTRIFWVLVLAVFLAASALENGVKFWRHITGDAPLSLWSAALHLAGGLLMGCLLMTVIVNLFAALRQRVQTRKRT